jgi:ParB family chromosome partitioning protein
MTNPFTKSLDEFRGQHVRAVSHDGRTYQGFVERLHHHDRHVVLRGATNQAGDHVGRVLVSHVDVLETTEPTGRVERIALHAIEPAPYHAREFDAADNRGYIQRVRSDGWAGSFPTVRPASADGDLEHPGDRGFEIVAGHKRIWVAGEAGLKHHPVQIIEIDAWTATRRFVADHLPTESDLRGNGESQDGYYTQVEIEAAIDSLVERWGRRALDFERVAFNVARLDLQGVVDRTGGGDGREPPTPEQIKALRDARGWTQSDLADELNAANNTVSYWETGRNTPGEEYAAQLWALHEEAAESTIDGTAEDDEDVGDAETGDTEPTAGDSEDAGGYPCMDCGRAFDSQRALSIHQGHKHVDDDRDADSNGHQDTPEYESATEDGVPAIRQWTPPQPDSQNGHGDTATGTQTRGDDVEADGQSSYPKKCGCGVVCDRHLVYLVHRTEAHGSPQQDLGRLQPGEFEELAEQSETVLELADSLGWKPERTLRALVIYGFDVTDSDGEFAKDGSASDILGGVTDAVATESVDEPSPAGGERA